MNIVSQLPSQSAMSRFLSKPFDWLTVVIQRFVAIQEQKDFSLVDGDLIALDDTKVDHPYGKMMLLLFWLFDSSEKRSVWCMNLLTTVVVCQNGLEYPLFWRFWRKGDDGDESVTKIELAKQMLSELRKHCDKKLWVAMDRWFLCKEFFVWLQDHNFYWVTKAKWNTALFKKVIEPVYGRERFVLVNAKELIREVWPHLNGLSGSKGDTVSIGIEDIYIKLPKEVIGKRGKAVIKQVFKPIAAVAIMKLKEDTIDLVDNTELKVDSEGATFCGAYLLISNRVDSPKDVVQSYAKRWKIEVFFRNAKQDLGLASCQARNEYAHFAHVEMLFFAETLISYIHWLEKEKGDDSAPSHHEMIRSLFNALCRIECLGHAIQVHFGIESECFSSIIQKFWPDEIALVYWKPLPATA